MKFGIRMENNRWIATPMDRFNNWRYTSKWLDNLIIYVRKFHPNAEFVEIH